jgi:hypothetical protein
VHDDASGDYGDRDDAIERRLRELTAEVSQAAQKSAEAAAKREKRAQRSGHGRLRAASLTAIVILAVGGLIAWRVSGSSSSAPSDTRTVHNGLVPTGSAASGLASVAAPGVPGGPPADPFAGTPAEQWPEGAAGIALPAAAPAGDFTAAQVAAAEQTTRNILIAAQLDWPTLRGGAPTAFASLLSSQQRAYFLDNLDNNTLKDDAVLNTRVWVVSFAPGTTTFVTNVVKVHGSMSAGTGVLAGRTALKITVNYLFAYAVQPPGHPDEWMRIVAHNYGAVYFAQWDDPGGPLEPWLQNRISPAGAQCGMADGYVHPDYPSAAPSSVQPSGVPRDPYSTATPPDSSTAGCGATTGT